MEKTNELNKFLSYIHMGNSIYRIYYKEAVSLKNEKLTDLIVSISETFKKHEETITKEIEKYGEKATESLTMAGLIGVYKEYWHEIRKGSEVGTLRRRGFRRLGLIPDNFENTIHIYNGTPQ